MSQSQQSSLGEPDGSESTKATSSSHLATSASEEITDARKVSHEPPEVSPQTPEIIKGFEGFRSRPYRCPAGVWTYGYGFTQDLKDHPVTQSTQSITQAQADERLLVLVGRFAASVLKFLHVPVNPNQLGALVSLGFNIGVGALSHSTLLRKLNAGDVSGASAQFPAWNRGGGEVLPGLVSRRTAERKLFDTPWKPA